MTQPIATIIAACIAVAAAVIGLLGILWNTRHQTRLDEKKAAREQAEARRLERADLFVSVVEQVDQVSFLYFLARQSDEDGDAPFNETNEELRRLRLTTIRLELLGYQDAAQPITSFIDTMTTATTSFAVTTEQVDYQRNLIMRTLSGEVLKPPTIHEAAMAELLQKHLGNLNPK